MKSYSFLIFGIKGLTVECVDPINNLSC